MATCPECGATADPAEEVCPACGQIMPPGQGPAPDPEYRPPPPMDAPTPTAARDAGEATGDDTVGRDATASIPWEDRGRLGFWPALWRTWVESVFRPVAFFRKLEPRGGFGAALGYAVLLTAVALLFSFYWASLEALLTGEENPAILVVTSVVALAFTVPLYIGFLYVMAAVVHVGFMVVGSGRQGYEATFRALAYSAGPSAFAIFPFFGPLVGLVWGAAIAFIAVRETQRTTNGRAVLGFLVPLIALWVFFVMLGVILALLVDMSGLQRTL